jgi:hypothetical protein
MIVNWRGLMSKYADRIFEQFVKEQHAFNRWKVFAGLLCVFCVFIFIPFLSLLGSINTLKIQLYDINNQLESTQSEIDIVTTAIQRADTIIKDASQFQSRYTELSTWVRSIEEIEVNYPQHTQLIDQLRNSLTANLRGSWPVGASPRQQIISQLLKSHPNIMIAYQSSQQCFFKLEIDWLLCQFNQHRQVINEPLSKLLYDRSLSHKYTAKLAVEIQSLANKYNASLLKRLEGSALKNKLHQYIEDEIAVIRQWFEVISQERSNLVTKNTRYQVLQQQSKTTDRLLNERKASLAQASVIKSPIGNMTIAFNELLVYVPFIWLLVLSNLVQSSHKQLLLRAVFKEYADDDQTSQQALSLIMPVWLAPAHQPLLKSLFLAIILILASAAIIGLYVILLRQGVTLATLNADVSLGIAATLIASLLFTYWYVRLTKRYWQHA